MVSDLSNFKTKGDVAYDKLDPQIKEGVDYFPDNTSGAKGFTPSTDLLTKYNKFMKDVRQNNTLPNQYDGQANILAPNAGLRINDNKTRSAYGSEGEYLEPAGVGISSTNHILSSDNVLGVRVQPKFTSEFMTTPIADYVSKFKIPYDSDVYNVQQHISSGPTQFIIKPFENPPSRKYPNAHGSDFMSKINFTSRYAGSFVGAGSKTLGVLRVIHTADNPLATQNANYNSLKNEGPFNGVSDFSVKTTKRLYNDSSYIKDLFEFEDGFGRDNFNNVPSGINDEGNFGTTDFRTVANKGPFDGNSTHPIILRKPGSNWDNVLNESIIGGTPGNILSGALGVVGLLTRTSRDLADKTRIFRFLISTKGISFVAKQFAFQALNPTIESKLYNPLSTLGIAGASDLLQGDVGGILRAAGSFLFPTHVERHLGGTRYEKIILGPAGSRIARTAQAFGTDLTGNFNVPTSNTGVGLFDNFVNRQVGNVMRVIDTVDAALLTPMFGLSNPNKYAFPISSAPKSVVDGRPSFIGGADLALEDVRSALEKRGGNFNPSTATSRIDLLEEEGLIKRHSTLAYSDLKKSLSYEGTLIGPKELNEDLEGLTEKDYKSRLAAYDVVKGIGNGIARYEREDVVDNPKLGAIKGNMLSPNVDKVNITPYGATVKGEKINVNDSVSTKDFIKFRFKDIVNNKFIIFRAILEGITDTVTPEYSEENYIGRPDKVYVYQGADRDISFTFSIYPKTKQEMEPLITKLNHLVGLCYPTFSDTERMQTPFMELTMGDMYNGAPGILRGLTITVEEQSTWELDEGLQFPHFIKAACEFRLIGKYVPDARGKHYDLPSINDIQRV